MTTHTLELDYEGGSEIDLIKQGLDLYTRHISTRAFMAAYALDGGEFQLWEAHKAKIPSELVDALMDSRVEKWAFNAQFERVFTRRVLKIPTPIKGWRCTQVLASLLSFPGTLAQVGERIGLPAEKQKLAIGKRLINLFCKPQRITKNQPHEWRDWRTDPEEWELFCQYCLQDGEAERAMRRRLIRYPVPAFEWDLYEIDQVINDRGVPVDTRFVQNAIGMAAKRKGQLTEEMRAVTGLNNPGSPEQLKGWLRERGYPFEDIRKESVAKVLTTNKVAGGDDEDAGFLKPEAVKALKLRQWQARLSVKKYDAIMLRIAPDGYLRYLLQMAGAARTARWAGRGPQGQNLPSTPAFFDDNIPLLARITEAIRDNDYEALELFTEEPMEVLVGALRSSFRAPDGEQFVVSDLVSIESGTLAWLSGCKRLLAVFREGRDPYMDFATEFFGIPYNEVTRPQRKVCKPPSLGCGYRLSGGELRDGKRTGLWGYAENMGIDISRDDAHRSVKVFRGMYPEIPVFWKALEIGIERTMKTKRDTMVGHIRFEYRKPFLMMWLPSARPIYYYQPQMKMRTVYTGRYTPWRTPAGMDYNECMFRYGVRPGEEVEIEETYQKLTFTYMGQSQLSRAWTRIDTHGGRTTEQVTQGTAREVLAYGMVRTHRAGFRLCSHVHDEQQAIHRIGSKDHNYKRMEQEMAAPLAWAPGLPLGAKGWTGQFYRKD